MQYASFGIQMHLQADAVHARRLREWLRHWRMAIEQTPEEFVAGTQNCRLELAVSVAGKSGTLPIPGNVRNGMTALSLLVG
ncbi:hypothetical protein D3C87_1221270 [compost metagenome]